MPDPINKYTDFQPGQRWVSEMEPQLGVGTVIDVSMHFVVINFPAIDSERRYAVDSAPLVRVRFKPGDEIKSAEGQTLIIVSVSEQDGLITYHTKNDDIHEKDLSSFMSFTTPKDRLFNGFADSIHDYNLRYRAHLLRQDIRKSSVRGFVGGRIDLIPHQLYVAHEVSSRQVQRVLLSDETGLGKTIEACLILHRLLISGKINRVLIVVPLSLVHQWFVELLRKFNLFFRIFDLEYFQSIESINPDINPFQDDQLILCSLDFLNTNDHIAECAISAGWDMTVVDEAHHLTEGSASLDVVRQLSRKSRGLILLTATPEQLGRRSHFMRLNLLDPDRYYDFEKFDSEETKYREISEIIRKLTENRSLCANELSILKQASPDYFGIKKATSQIFSEKDDSVRNSIVNDLIDRYGTGRAVFRNTRFSVPDFSGREAHLIALKGSLEDIQNQTNEFNGGDIESDSYKNDTRIDWLADLLMGRKKEKVLLICNSVSKAKAIEESLKRKVNVHVVLFHEQLTLLQRDRNAAIFAAEKGAQLLICSEIGSEGRNFQFCHHLVLFDIPFNPELLEQRIGRLDRIGQQEVIQIYIPFIIGSEYELLANWYSEGLGALEQNIAGAYQVYAELGAELLDVVTEKQSEKLQELIRKTQKMRDEVTREMREGRDYLLELNSNRADIAEKLISEINSADRDVSLEKFMYNIFELYDIRSEKISDRTYKLDTIALSNPEFPLPLMKEEGLIVTFDRKIASQNESIEFLSRDHPMVAGVFDLLVSSEKGNCSIALLSGTNKRELLLEMINIAECIAPSHLNVDRFLPPTPIRSIVNHKLENCSEKYSNEFLNKRLKQNIGNELINIPEVRQELIPNMFNACRKIAERKIKDIIREAVGNMESSYSTEIRRLVNLKSVNNNIMEADLTSLEKQRALIGKALGDSRLRLDALRLINKH